MLINKDLSPPFPNPTSSFSKYFSWQMRRKSSLTQRETVEVKRNLKNSVIKLVKLGLLVVEKFILNFLIFLKILSI